MIHKEYDGRKVRIPATAWSKAAIGDVVYAGWDDWYIVKLDGKDYCRENADEIAKFLLPQ